jgi:hypothetical protein
MGGGGWWTQLSLLSIIDQYEKQGILHPGLREDSFCSPDKKAEVGQFLPMSVAL